MKEKDLNYIAGLEKAIKKKYGEEAIQNPASSWDEDKEKKYLEQLQDFLEKQNKKETTEKMENVDGVLITRKLLNKESNFNCPLCRDIVERINDDVYLIKYDCCEKCYINYVEHREERWLKGWRPNNVKKST